ncbi:MAG TPA: NAD(P)-dependent alcohol dehydrogenase [Candidatus Eisenbacteria bacterium]|nr:NAD(P)-dependent alcohol dehydrogenase [Candidatus Eisenbacteria bacterium]
MSYGALALALAESSGRALMKAAVYHRYGPPDVVKIADVLKPEPGPKQVLVRMHAATVSAGDARLRSANVPRGFGIPLRLGFGVTGPRIHILGFDVAGEVAAVGESVTSFAPGDKVFGAGSKCHAEYVALREDDLVAMPSNLGFAESAALPFGGTTALYYLRDKAKVERGERVLVNGAAGAVGTAAVQIARHYGAVVTGICSAGNEVLVRSLGADRVVDYTKEDFARGRETYDVILDAVGNCPFERCQAVLAPGGRLLVVVATLGELLGAWVRPSRAGRRVLAGVARTHKADLVLLGSLAQSGAFKPVIGATCPFARIAEAHALVDTGHKKGNVVVTIE